MTKKDLKKRIDGLNEFMLSNTDKELLILSISNDYTYNKAIALINKSSQSKDWYSISDKNCFKSWNEAEAFLDGLCLAKNTSFNDKEYER